MRQPALAPAALGGSVLTGAAAFLIGAWHIGDCVAYQTRQGQCTPVIEDQALPMLAGAAAVLAGWGGFNTVNPALSRSARRDPRTGRFIKQEPEQ